MQLVDVTEHPALEELLTLPGRVLSRLDVAEGLAEPADERFSGERVWPGKGKTKRGSARVYSKRCA